MEMENMKNMVVLKNLPSNIIEEAFVIIKPNMKMKPINTGKKAMKSHVKVEDSKEYIIKEAEMLISDYISNVEQKPRSSNNTKKIEKKYKQLKNITFLLGIITLISLIIHIL